MLFNSYEFVGLFLVTFFLYYLPFLKKSQVWILILSSFVFYAYQNPVLLLLLLASIIINGLTSYQIAYAASLASRKFYAVAGIIFNLLLLIFFKYGPLLSHTFFQESSDIGNWILSIPLPIGISFYTFEGISLVVDSFKKTNTSEYKSTIVKNFIRHQKNVFLFISFFPHLIAGPILKAHDFIPQIGEKTFKNIDWNYCYKKLVLGYFLKMVIADNLKDQTFWLTYPFFQTYSSFSLVGLLFGYSFQIFSDFAGYSLIALGLAGLFGYRLQSNFNLPYISQSFSEFWKRWHISLSTFLKEYLYIPLGGNRRGTGYTYFNLFVTMFLGGLWHGSSWSYACWGSLHGIALAGERFFQSRKIKLLIPSCIKIIAVFTYVSLAWVLFKLPHFDQAVLFFKCLFTNVRGYPLLYKQLYYIGIYSTPIIFYHLTGLSPKLKKYMLKFEPYIYGLLFFLIITNSGSTGTFIYFQF